MTPSPAVLTAATEAEALEQLHRDGCTDGLPVVVPTRARVDAMAAAVDLDPSTSLGEIGPNRGEATVEAVAVNAVMAGCLPDVFPIVVAAARAVCDPRLDMTEVQSTTHNLGPLVIVNGPAGRSAGVASGFGALGPGHRANATIGRALRLCLVNIGGGRPGESDMALLGHPGKFTFCLAEDEEASPWPPLHTSRGFDADQSAVTVTCVEGPHSVLAFTDADDPTTPDRVLDVLARALSGLPANNAHFGKGTQVVVLNPDHANVLADAGHTRSSIVEALVARAVNTQAELAAVRGGGPPAEPDRLVPAIPSPDHLLVLVAGGTGLYSTVMPSWGAGSHGNIAVSVEVTGASFA